MILRPSSWLLAAVAVFLRAIITTQLNCSCRAFQVHPGPTLSFSRISPNNNRLHSSHRRVVDVAQEQIEQASQILSDWDRQYGSPTKVSEQIREENVEPHVLARARLTEAVRTLNEKARQERTEDHTLGRCMLGICASSLAEGMATLKSWVTALELPRGLLHGADKDGVPLEFLGGVYIKYNSGGVYTFADIRKSQMGFDALWKPGDAMLEEYDGTVRGIYFQVELSDGEFRQYLLPLDLMEDLL